MNPVEYNILLGLEWVAFASLTAVILVYGFLTPWWKSRTGIGFMSTQVAFWVATSLTLLSQYGKIFPMWVYYLAWILVILAVNLGITWNIIVKQFVQHRGDEVADKSQDHLKQTGIVHEVLTGEIPIQKETDHDRGIRR